MADGALESRVGRIPEDIDEGELTRRVIYALLRPAVRIAGAFGVALKDLSGLVEMAYFHEMRDRGLTLRETGEALSVSQRKAVRLASRLRENFLGPELRHNLPRRIEFMLWSRPMSEARLRQVLPTVDADAISGALAELEAEGRIEPRNGRTIKEYVPVSALRKLPRDGWMQRVGALGSFAENLADAAYGRFFRNHPHTFARTLSFQVPEGGEEELQRWYEAVVLAKIIELDEAAQRADHKAPMQLSVCWAPYEYIRTRDEDDHEDDG